MTTIDRFIPAPLVRERHDIVIRAPAQLVFEVAEEFDLQSIPLVRWIFRARSIILGAHYAPLRGGLAEQMLKIGWGELVRTPGKELVMGGAAQPWLANVQFRAIPPAGFASFDEPGFVKIAWTLEAESLGPALTRFQTETRVVATDDFARKKFRDYWRKFGIGIVMIRWLCLPALKKEAVKKYRMALRQTG